jgi:hypothetical protein
MSAALRVARDHAGSGCCKCSALQLGKVERVLRSRAHRPLGRAGAPPLAFT